jgi:hypothetical protein
MFTCTLRNPSLVLVAALAAFALTIGSANARGGGGSRGGSASARAGFTGSTAVRAAPTLRGQQGSPIRLPQQSTRAVGAVASTGSKSADPPVSRARALQLLLLNSDISTSPTPPPPVPLAPPMPAVSAPEGQIQPVAPLSPPIATTNFGAGRTGVTATTVSPYFSYSAPESPSQVAPSLPGGGGGTLEDCMGFWDRATHMTKNEWRAACQRTLHRLDDVTKEFAREPSPARSGR